jgi:hypothetical protein
VLEAKPAGGYAVGIEQETLDIERAVWSEADDAAIFKFNLCLTVIGCGQEHSGEEWQVHQGGEALGFAGLGNGDSAFDERQPSCPDRRWRVLSPQEGGRCKE